jgi:hypothetical protein
MSDLRLPFEPRVAQKVILGKLARHRFVTSICHRRLGKTLLGVYYLVTEALATDMDDFRGYYFGATQKAAKQVAWHYFKKLLAPLSQAGRVEFRETELQAQLDTGAWITLAGSENIEAYRGIYIDRIVADEVASWQGGTYAWFEVLRPAMADRAARGLIIGTVKGLDMLYDFYVRGISDDEVDEDWGAVKLPASLTGIINARELRELKHSMSEEAYEREMECNFFAESPEVLITPREARDAQLRVLSPAERASVRDAQVVLGVDIGRTGDPSVVYKRQGLEVTKLLSVQDPDNMSVADRVSRLIRVERPTTVFVDAGQGQGVIDRLYRLGHNDVVVEVRFNDASPERAATNMRAAMYYRLKKFLSRGVIPDDPELLKEIVNQLLADDPNNRVKLARKDLIKQRIGRSPNDADAVALTLADESVDEIMRPEQRKATAMRDYLAASGVAYKDPSMTYDPLGYMDSYAATNDSEPVVEDPYAALFR